MTYGQITSTRDVGKPYYDNRMLGTKDYVISNAHGLFYPTVEMDTGKGKLVIAEAPSFMIESLRISFEL